MFLRYAVAGRVVFMAALITTPVMAQPSDRVPDQPGQGPPYPAFADSSLRLQVTPVDTQVFIDGYYAGIVDDYDGRFQRLHVEAGQHTIQLLLTGHRLYSQDVYLQPGNTFTVRHTMEALGEGEPEPVRPTGAPDARRTPPSFPPPSSSAPPPPAQDSAASTQDRPSDDAYGSLAIRVQPGDAVIIIDGERWNGGSTDALEVQLGAGPHTVEVRKAGFRGYLTEVRVTSGETTKLNVALSPEP